jgi:hypothetical protein
VAFHCRGILKTGSIGRNSRRWKTLGDKSVAGIGRRRSFAAIGVRGTPDGSYKADPAKVKSAIDAKKPIPNGQCVAACSRLSGVTPHTASWTRGKSILELNDTTDVGLAVASFGEDKKFNQAGGDQNSAIYMGHDKSGNVMVADQWPPPNA